MLRLSIDDRRNLREALTSGFRTYSSLERFVADNFDDFRLNEIADAQDTVVGAAARLIEACEERGLELPLILALHKARPQNPEVQTLMSHLQERLPGGDIVVRAGADPELPVGAEDPRSTHLVIAVFWEKPSEQKLWIQPKLCYRKVETRELVQESLVKERYSIPLKDFPGFLEKLVDFVVSRLSGIFSDPLHPWKLTIELFIPIDLLSLPLTKWCGQDSELQRSHAIVVGCSDRFDPNQPGRAAKLHNQLKRGWQRWQEKVPDQVGATLQNLNWLKSDAAHQEQFERYSGFQCYGDWLVPGQQYLKNWQAVVESGIPLALWMCEGQAPPAAIAATFEHLIEGTRFEFLDKIPSLRDEQRRTCDHCVGVFYEDPNYVPDVPRVEEQFFAWPGA